jgi:hypothetical protein
MSEGAKYESLLENRSKLPSNGNTDILLLRFKVPFIRSADTLGLLV